MRTEKEIMRIKKEKEKALSMTRLDQIRNLYQI